MPDVVLGPLLRYAGETDAIVWVEADAACEVEVLGCRSHTFHVEGHHYALVHVTGLEPGSKYEYKVLLDGEKKWPGGLSLREWPRRSYVSTRKDLARPGTTNCQLLWSVQLP